jgi:(1->4)-alpha-D-glucan 1-alpha-D-glucosylmutase
LNVLSDIPETWRKAVRRWSMINRSRRTVLEGGHAPDRNDEYLFYQTLMGIWPASSPEAIDFPELRQRIATYMDKAVKEAKVHSSWINPNMEYENGVRKFVERVLDPSIGHRFMEDFLPLQKSVARMGAVNSLSQTLLKITSPGIPDFYQGTELWDLSLVDPDNRRPVDFEHRQNLLNGLESILDCSDVDLRRSALADILHAWEDGRVKMFVTASGLRFRRKHPELFLRGDYYPLQVEGEYADHVVAFSRQYEGMESLTVVPRRVAGLMEAGWPLGESVWGDTRILVPGGREESRYRDLLSGAAFRARVTDDWAEFYLKDLFSTWPVALLTGGLGGIDDPVHN